MLFCEFCQLTLCCVVLCCAVLCCAVLFCVVLCCVVLCCVVVFYIIWSGLVWSSVLAYLCCAVSCRVVSCRVVSCRAVLLCISVVLYWFCIVVLCIERIYIYKLVGFHFEFICAIRWIWICILIPKRSCGLWSWKKAESGPSIIYKTTTTEITSVKGLVKRWDLALHP